MEVAQMIGRARRRSGQSIRELAATAGVATSTITRINAGSLEPTVTMVERLLAAACAELQLEVVPIVAPASARLAELADAWDEGATGRLRLHWTRWRAFLDHLALHPEDVPEAIYPTPPISGHLVIDNLMAAVAETIADEAGWTRPRWTHAVTPLDEPFAPPVARQIAGRSVLPQLAARNLMIDAGSLWRSGIPVDA